MPCWVPECKGGLLYQVAEVRFDNGTDNGVLFSTRQVNWSPAPSMCLLHKKIAASELANAVLVQAWEDSLFDTWPARWTVGYQDGHHIAGDVGAKPEGLEHKGKPQSVNANIWCQKCWKAIVLPDVLEHKTNAIALTLNLFSEIVKDPAARAFIEQYPKGEHQKAVTDFLAQNGPACCYLGEARLREIMAQSGSDAQMPGDTHA